MTNEEAILIIDSLPAKSDVYNWRDVADAFGTAIKALQNAKKYEKALELAVRDSDKSGTDIWCHDCPYGDNERLDHCWECGMKYYKRKAGIEAEDE